MKLHQDINAFRVLLEQIHERTGYRTDVLEKDYYVVLMLCELAEKKKAGLPSYFKGGTALYKALKTTGGRTATSCAEPVQEKGRHGEITAADSDFGRE